MKDLAPASLLAHNTFGIDARCRRLIEYESEAEAAAIARTLTPPFLIIGGGSNLLLTQDYEGTVVRSAIKGIELPGGGRLRAGSGMTFDSVVEQALESGLYGMENLSAIPGDVGASAVQNIGAYGAEAADIVSTIEAVRIGTGEKVIIHAADCHYAYRQSRFKGEWKNLFLITHVTYQLHTTFTPHLDYGNIRAELAHRGISEPSAMQLRQVVVDIRRAKLPDPEVQGNAGSFFMNPMVGRDIYEKLAARHPNMPHYSLADGREKIPAAWLIEQSGWKGRALGRAATHSVQPLVLVNLGGATGQEIVNLCEAIRHDVREKFGIDLHPEVNII